MGGNININGLKSEPITFSEDNKRAIDLALKNIFYLYKRIYGSTLADDIHYSGSTRDFMTLKNSMFNSEINDVDIQIHLCELDRFSKFLKYYQDFMSYVVLGVKRHGQEISVLMENYEGNIHQFDFQGVENPGSRYSLFLHFSDWADRLEGIKGAHHKILLNACGLDEYKFSITHGCRSRTDETDPGSKTIEDVSERLFGIRTNGIRSFIDVVSNIKCFKSREEQLLIKKKFKEHVSSLNHLDSTRALEYLDNHL